MKNKPDFDCVEMKHLAATRIHRQISGMNKAEKLEYWRKWYEKMPRAGVHKKTLVSGVAETPGKEYGKKSK
jgi:hypothetical protein